MKIREPGWECPKCQRIWAPKIAACGACNARQTLPSQLIPRFIPTKKQTDFSPQWTVDRADWRTWPGVEL